MQIKTTFILDTESFIIISIIKEKIIKYTYKNKMIKKLNLITLHTSKIMQKKLNQINFYLLIKTTPYVNIINMAFPFTIGIIGNYSNPYDSPDTFYGEECRDVEILPCLPPIPETTPQESSFSCDYVPMTPRPELPAVTAPTTIPNDIAHPVINNQNTDCVISQMTSPLEQEIVTAIKSAPSEPHPLIISKLGTPQSQVELPTASKSIPVSVMELLPIISKSSPVSLVEQHVQSDNIILNSEKDVLKESISDIPYEESLLAVLDKMIADEKVLPAVLDKIILQSENTIIKELRDKYDELNLILYCEDILRKKPLSNNNNNFQSDNYYTELTADLQKQAEEQSKQQVLQQIQSETSIEKKALKIINNIMLSVGSNYQKQLENNPDTILDLKIVIADTMKNHVLSPLWKISPGEGIRSNQIAGMITNICQHQVSNNPYNLGNTELDIMTHINVNVNLTNRAIISNMDPDIKLNDDVAYNSLFKAYSKKTK